MKFLSRTEIREPQLGNPDICNRLLERVARSIQEEMTEPKSVSEVLGMEKGLQQSNSKAYLTEDWKFTQVGGIDEYAEVFLKNERASIRLTRNRNRNEKAKSAPMQKGGIGRRTQQGQCLNQETKSSGRDEEVSDLKHNSLKLGDDSELLFQFTAKRMDLVKRGGVWQKKELAISQNRKCAAEYDISIDLLKGKGYAGASNSQKTQQRNEIKQKVCLRFERRFKSAPKERIQRNSDETVKSSKIRLYPFYEAKWGKDEIIDKECAFLLRKEVKSNSKMGAIEFTDFGKSLVDSENEEKANDHLKISSLQLVPKKILSDNQKTDSKVQAEENRKEEPMVNVMKVVCSPKPKLTAQEEGDRNNESSPDLTNLLMTNSGSLRETIKLIARITASSMLLTDKQILKLMERGNLKISKFLIIKKLLLSIHPHKYDSSVKESQPRKEIVSLLFAVLGFIDRCEKILKEAKGISSLELFEKREAEIDCTERGVVVGKMPAISVVSYNHKSDIDNEDYQDSTSGRKKKSRRLTKRKEICVTKDNEEEHLVKKAVSIASLRRSIFVRAMDLAMNNHWERSYLLKKRYMPKRKKIRALKTLCKRHHKKHVAQTASSKHQIKKASYPSVGTAPSSRNSVSTCFQSDELQDVHIPTVQSVLNEIARDVNACSVELSSDIKQDQIIPNDEKIVDTKNTSKNVNDQDITIQKTQAQIPQPSKVCEFLKRRVKSKLQATFDLYPKIHKLMSSLHDRTENMIDVRATRDLKTDFKSHFKLIEENRYEMYCKAFAKTDKQNNGYISVEMVKSAAKFVDSVASCPTKYIEYTLIVLDMLVLSKVTIKMFCIVCGVLERMLEGGAVIRDAVDSMDLLMSEGKMIWYKEMFYDSSDLDRNYINLETVKLELFAGGMDAEEEKQISDKILSRENQRISYLDFIAYIPLFIAIHDKICANAFD